jgi:hypothetical protein
MDELKETFRLVRAVAGYLYGYTLVAVPVIVNPLTLNLDLKPDESANNVLLVTPSGTGKTTLLYHILQKSNPKWFPELPDKFFESQILLEPDEKFNRKVWVFDDLITVFRGTSTKQREQLMGFFNSFLTKGEYSRKGLKKSGRIVCIFGLAKEHYKEYGKHMFLQTFTDRFMPVKFSFSERDKKAILELRSGRGSVDLPRVVLPFRDEPVNISVPREFCPEVNKLALLLDARGVMSFVRAQTHIINFLKANADLNGRGEVCEADVKLFKLTLSLYFGAESGTADVKVREFILEASMEGRIVSGREVEEAVASRTGVSDRWVRDVLAKLRSEGAVFYRQSSGGYEYWI